MSRPTDRERGAFMAYGQACTMLEIFDDANDQLEAFPLLPEELKLWRGIHAAVAAEIRDIGALRAARRSLGDCGDSGAHCDASESVSVR